MSQSQGSGTRGTRSQSQQPAASTSPNTNTNANANGSQDDYADDTIRIMLATDNHIGYMERDPIRGQDSINTFREILQLAVKHEVDLILLGGDLFHENKPSRECLYNVTALLREFTLGDKPVQVELLSDPLEGKAHGYTFPAVNYEDPNLNVGIPVFSIHGNHDDPQGAGADGALSALDILSVTGLVNYMGKFDLPMNDSDTSTPGIMVRPVLLRKGGTRLGLYGVGNVKDQRMHFELRSNRVRMFMPRDKERWFNLMVVHQNRVKHGPQEYVPEGMFDDSIDLVVWGHEHDCRIIPEPVAGKNYYITQPGSSVATSLADGEAVEKHVALLQIQRKEFKLTPIPLRTVRPFVIEEVVLSDAAEEEGAQLDLGDQMSITRFLRAKVNKLIDRANQLWDERNKRAVEEGEEELPRMLPLVRLKVDTTGVTETSNPIRFGQEFTGRIANPRDLLVFHRSKKASLRSSLAHPSSSTTKVTADDPDLSIDDPTLTTQEKLAKVRVGTLVREYLKAQELQLLGEGGMSDAIRMFVEKDDAHAIQTHVNKALKVLMKNVQPSVGAAGVGEDGEVDEGDLEEMLAKAREQQEKEYTAAQESAKPSKSNSKGKGKSNENAAESDRESVDSMMMDLDDIPGMPRGAASDDFDAMFDDDEEDEPPPPPPKRKAGGAAAKGKAAAKEKVTARGKAKAPAKKAPAKGKGKKKAVESDDEDEAVESDFNQDDDDDDEDEDEAPPPKPAAKRTNRAAVLSQPTTAAKKAPAKKATGGRGTKQTQQTQQTQSQLTFAPAGRTSGRAAAGRARGKMVEQDDDDDDD